MAHCITGVPLLARVRFPTFPAEFSTSRSVISRERPLGTLKTTSVPLPEACWARLIVPLATAAVDSPPEAPALPFPAAPAEVALLFPAGPAWVPLPVCHLPPGAAPVGPPVFGPAALFGPTALFDPAPLETGTMLLPASCLLTAFWAVERIWGRSSAYQRITSSRARPTSAATSV